MYIQDMANKKRDLNGYKKELDRYKLNRSDILAIEKMLRVYGDAKEMQSSGISKPPNGQKHMPRKYVDRHIRIGRYRPFTIQFGRDYYGWTHAGVDYVYDADSVKFLPDFIRKARYVEISCKPGITITFKPLSTTLYAQTHYATGKELKIMKETVLKIEIYLRNVKKSYINVCQLQ